MPKKHSKFQYGKPNIPVHPSLSSSSTLPSHGADNFTSAPSTSVNELIQHLRRSQAPSTAERPFSDANPHPTVHPSLKAILQVPDTPAPRPRLPNGSRRRQAGPAGPPPPKSWLADSMHAPRSCRRDLSTKKCISDTMRRLDRLPDMRLPNEHTLMHQTMKSLAKNWLWHVEYDQFYLPTLRERIKEAILAYISTYSPESLTRSGLELLFLDDTELDNATGSEIVSHLDLSGAAIKDFSQIFEKRSSSPTSSTPSPSIPDSWDAPNPSLPQLLAVTRFPSLTHLSLAHTPFPSWRALLAALPHIHPLTHLSLAYWPNPSLTPNAKTATTVSPAGNVQYGGSDFYSVSDGDWSEAASILRRLSRGTLCLKWLDLEGCTAWISALAWKDRCGGGGIEWSGAWRGVETVRCVQARAPKLVQDGKDGGDVVARTGVDRPAGVQSEVPGGQQSWDVETERMRYRETVYAKDFLDRETVVRRVEELVVKGRRESGLKGPGFEMTDMRWAEGRVRGEWRKWW